MKTVDMTGVVAGHLTVLERAGSLRGKAAWRVRCTCGVVKVVDGDGIRNKRQTSCGCRRMEGMRAQLAKNETHGGRRTPEYETWCGMIRRCENPKNHAFHRYGGRGISICERWRNDFSAFLADVGPRPSPEHSIDRIDNDRGYEPDNCRWATALVQARNTRSFTGGLSHVAKEDLVQEVKDLRQAEAALVAEIRRLRAALAQIVEQGDFDSSKIARRALARSP